MEPQGAAAVGWAVDVFSDAEARWLSGVVTDFDPDHGRLIIDLPDGRILPVEQHAVDIKFKDNTNEGVHEGDVGAIERRTGEQEEWLSKFDADSAPASAPAGATGADTGTWDVVYGETADDAVAAVARGGHVPGLEADVHGPSSAADAGASRDDDSAATARMARYQASGATAHVTPRRGAGSSRSSGGGGDKGNGKRGASGGKGSTRGRGPKGSRGGAAGGRPPSASRSRASGGGGSATEAAAKAGYRNSGGGPQSLSGRRITENTATSGAGSGANAAVGADEAVVNGLVVEARGLPLQAVSGGVDGASLSRGSGDDAVRAGLAGDEGLGTGECNPLVKVSFVAPGGQSLLFRRKTELHRTAVVPGTTAPAWLDADGAFKLAVAPPMGPRGASKPWTAVGGDLLFQVQHQKGRTMQVIGQVLVPISSLVDDQAQPGQQATRDQFHHVLVPGGGRAVGSDLVAVGAPPTAGELRVRLQMVLPGADDVGAKGDEGVEAVSRNVSAQGPKPRAAPSEAELAAAAERAQRRTYGSKTAAELESEDVYGLGTVAEGLSPPPRGSSPLRPRPGPGDLDLGDSTDDDDDDHDDRAGGGGGRRGEPREAGPVDAEAIAAQRGRGAGRGPGPDRSAIPKSMLKAMRGPRQLTRRGEKDRGGTLAYSHAPPPSGTHKRHHPGVPLPEDGEQRPEPIAEESHSGRNRRHYLEEIARENADISRRLKEAEEHQAAKLRAERKAMEEGPRAHYVPASRINRRKFQEETKAENAAAKRRTWLASAPVQKGRRSRKAARVRAQARRTASAADAAADAALEAAMAKAAKEGADTARMNIAARGVGHKPAPGTSRSAFHQQESLYQEVLALRSQLKASQDGVALGTTALRRAERGLRALQKQLREAANAPEVDADALMAGPKPPPPRAGDGWKSDLGRELTADAADGGGGGGGTRKRGGGDKLPAGMSESKLRDLQEEATGLHAQYHTMAIEARALAASRTAAASDAASADEELSRLRLALQRARIRQRWEQQRDLRAAGARAQGSMDKETKQAFDEDSKAQQAGGKKAADYQVALDTTQAATRDVKVGIAALQERIALAERRASQRQGDSGELAATLRAKVERKKKRLAEAMAERDHWKTEVEKLQGAGRAERLRAEIQDLHVKHLHRTQRMKEEGRAAQDVEKEIAASREAFDQRIRAEDASSGIKLARD